MCRDLEVSIESDRMEVDLCLFELEELNVILGMEFLPKYHAILDCFNKEVVLRNPGKFEVNFEGDKEVKFERIISVLHARKRVKKGHTTYLEHLVDTRVPKDNPSRMPIVCEYLDVFLKELSKLRPKREIEFTIEVVSRTTPISQTSYRMVPSEIKEFRNQLEEFGEKGYIRPSTVPWGGPVLFVKKKDGYMRLCINYH